MPVMNDKEFCCPSCGILANNVDAKKLEYRCTCCGKTLVSTWYVDQTKEVLDTSFDVRFRENEKLTWLPWIGKKYENTRVLVVAESHYTNKATEELVQSDIAAYMNDPWSTREIVAEYPLMGLSANWRNNGNRRNNPTFDNITRILVGDALLGAEDGEKRKRLWSCIAYMNFIQRPMRYLKDSEKERPTINDREIGWKALSTVLRVLKPGICIFAGLEASKDFNWYVKEVGINAGELNWGTEKINSATPRSAKIDINGTAVDCKFIKHPSKFFSWGRWSEFVFAGQHEVKIALRNAVLEG